MSGKTFNILVAGVGGQGILLASRVIAGAAVASGLDVKQCEVHGMAQRGGSVESHVRFGAAVFSPVITPGECDLIIGFEPLEAARHLHMLRAGGAVVYNSHRIETLGTSSGLEAYPDDINTLIASRASNIRIIDASRVAFEAGDPRAVNIAVLGAASKFLPLKMASLLESIRQSVAGRFLPANLKAFKLGTC